MALQIDQLEDFNVTAHHIMVMGASTTPLQYHLSQLEGGSWRRCRPSGAAPSAGARPSSTKVPGLV